MGVWSLTALTDPTEPGYTKKAYRQSLDGHRVGKILFHKSDSTNLDSYMLIRIVKC